MHHVLECNKTVYAYVDVTQILVNSFYNNHNNFSFSTNFTYACINNMQDINFIYLLLHSFSFNLENVAPRHFEQSPSFEV